MGPPARATTTRGLVDHVCLAYDGPDDLRDRGARYLADGLELGQRGVVVASADDADLARAVAAAAEDAASGGRCGHPVEVADAARVYGTGPVDVPATLDRFRGVLASALVDGFTGIRAVCLVTPVAADASLRRAFATWEHLAGAWQSTLPIASACCYDRRRVSDTVLQDLACLHPRLVTGGVRVPFRLYFRSGRLVLDGEVDAFSAQLLRRAVTLVRPVPGERAVIDARGLTFVDHRAIEALVEGLARPAGGVTLLGTRALPALLRQRLGIDEDVLDVLPWVA